jgi:hypothetical protein
MTDMECLAISLIIYHREATYSSMESANCCEDAGACLLLGNSNLAKWLARCGGVRKVLIVPILGLARQARISWDSAVAKTVC